MSDPVKTKEEVLKFVKNNWHRKIANQLRRFKVRECDLDDRRSDVYLKLVESDFLKNYNNAEFVKEQGRQDNFEVWLNNYIFRVCRCVASNSFRKAERDVINFYAPLEEVTKNGDDEVTSKKGLSTLLEESLMSTYLDKKKFSIISEFDIPDVISEKNENLETVIKRIRKFPSKAWSKSTHERLGGNFENSYETPFRWIVLDGMSVNSISKKTGLTKSRIYDWVDTLRRLVEEALDDTEGAKKWLK